MDSIHGAVVVTIGLKGVRGFENITSRGAKLRVEVRIATERVVYEVDIPHGDRSVTLPSFRPQHDAIHLIFHNAVKNR